MARPALARRITTGLLFKPRGWAKHPVYDPVSGIYIEYVACDRRDVVERQRQLRRPGGAAKPGNMCGECVQVDTNTTSNIICAARWPLCEERDADWRGSQDR